MGIIVTGSVAFDYIMSFPGHFTDHILPDKLDSISLSFLVDDMRKVYGGCGPNIAYSLALLDERPRLMATAGKDATEYHDWLQENEMLQRQPMNNTLTRENPSTLSLRQKAPTSLL